MAGWMEQELEQRKKGIPAGQVREVVEHMRQNQIDTVWDVQAAYDGEFLGLKDRCAFGARGLCCRNCEMGPCRLATGDVPQHLQLITPAINRSTCGKTVDDMVANMLLQTTIRGTAAHLGHALHLVELLSEVGAGTSALAVKDEAKLEALATALGVTAKTSAARATGVAQVLRTDFNGPRDGAPMKFVAVLAPKEASRLVKLELVPHKGACELIVEATHSTAHGMTNAAFKLLQWTLKLGVLDMVALAVSTEIQDILLGKPNVGTSHIGFDALDPAKVNIVVHGHYPPLAEMVVEAAHAADAAARNAGATGVNVVGLCCTGNEILMRHGLKTLGNNLQQELAIGTGLVDAMVVDVQCVFPSLSSLVGHFHTKLVTTMGELHMEEAVHVPMGHTAEETHKAAAKIVALGVEAYGKRDKGKAFLPKTPGKSLMAGFSVETLVAVLSKLDANDPLKPLIDAIANGTVTGAVLLAGCTSPKVQPDMSHVAIAKALIKENVLVIATGCAAGACARAGLLQPEAAAQAGDKLKGLLAALGKTAGLPGSLPPVLHFGSCVDNSRVVMLLKALADRLGVGVDKLPAVASAAELVTEKAIAIGCGALALGVTTHVGVAPKVMGSPFVVTTLAKDLEQLTGSKLIVAVDPKEAAGEILAELRRKRTGLGLN